MLALLVDMTSPDLGSLIDTVFEKTIGARNTLKNMDFTIFTKIRWKNQIYEHKVNYEKVFRGYLRSTLSIK